MLELKLFEGLDKITDADVREITEETPAVGEKVVGEVPNHLRRLLHLSVVIAQDLLKCMNDARNKMRTPNAELVKKVEAGKSRADLLRLIFWAELRNHLGLQQQSVLTIHKGWVVVEEPAKIPTLLDVIRMVGELAGEEEDDCGNPNCPIHGHLHRPEAETAGRGGGGPRVFAMGRKEKEIH